MRRHADPVTPEVRRAVLERDGGCVAAILEPGHVCANRWGSLAPGELTLDHVKDQPMMGKRAPSDADHLVTLCWAAHLGGWATSHRPALREYLRGRHE